MTGVTWMHSAWAGTPVWLSVGGEKTPISPGNLLGRWAPGYLFWQSTHRCDLTWDRQGASPGRQDGRVEEGDSFRREPDPCKAPLLAGDQDSDFYLKFPFQKGPGSASDMRSKASGGLGGRAGESRTGEQRGTPFLPPREQLCLAQLPVSPHHQRPN